jgi:hypothetical protein
MSESSPQSAGESAGSPPENHQPSGNAPENEAAERTRQRLRLLPPEVGAVLVTVGVAGLILPGPFGTPFILAGGLILAPRYFHRAELWLQKRFPDVHGAGRRRVDRFIDDFEKRYPRHPRRESGQ